MSAGKKEKQSLALLGVKITPALKEAIEEAGEALGIAPSTYARQLLMIGWRSRHEAPVEKNPREQVLVDRFRELPVTAQEDIVAMVKALHQKYQDARRTGSHPDAERINAEFLRSNGPIVEEIRIKSDEPLEDGDPQVKDLQPFMRDKKT